MITEFPRFLSTIVAVSFSVLCVACSPKTETASRPDSTPPPAPAPVPASPSDTPLASPKHIPEPGTMVPPTETKVPGETGWIAFNRYFVALEKFYAELLGPTDKLPKDMASFKSMEKAAKAWADDKDEKYKETQQARIELVGEIKRAGEFTQEKTPKSLHLESVLQVVQATGDIVRMLQPPSSEHLERAEWMMVNLRFNIQKLHDDGH